MAGRWLRAPGLGTLIGLWNSEVLLSHGAGEPILVALVPSRSACCILGPLLFYVEGELHVEDPHGPRCTLC